MPLYHLYFNKIFRFLQSKNNRHNRGRVHLGSDRKTPLPARSELHKKNQIILLDIYEPIIDHPTLEKGTSIKAGARRKHLTVIKSLSPFLAI